MFIAQVLVGQSIKLHKEIIQIENNMVKNPNWQEADQLAIYKCGRRVELGATEKQLQLAVSAGLEPRTSRFYPPTDFFLAGADDITKERRPGIKIIKCTPLSLISTS